MLFWTAFAPERFHFTPLAMFVVGNTLMIGFVLITLGVIALYIAKIHREVAQRPLYFVRSLINIDSA